jgi:hypothetical protein
VRLLKAAVAPMGRRAVGLDGGALDHVAGAGPANFHHFST